MTISHLNSLWHVSDDTVCKDQENEVTGTISVCAGKSSHVVYDRREVGGPIQLYLMDAASVSLQHT
jgi:hypothetical protein